MKMRKNEGENPIFPPAAGPRLRESRTEKIGLSPRDYLVIVIFAIFSFWLMFHTFGYEPKSNSILIASRLWSDFGANLPLIRSFSYGANLDRLIRLEPPDYPIYAGEPIKKHFLFYAFVGVLERAGMRIDWALNLPSIAGFFALLLGIYVLAQKLFKSVFVSVLSVLFFLFNGSLSFLRLPDYTLSQLVHIREFPAFAPWGPGDITAFWNLNIYTNQRHLAAGFAIGIWFLVWIISSPAERDPASREKKSIAGAILWGLIIGLLPVFHQPMLLIMAIILTSTFVFFPKNRWPVFIAGSIGFLLGAAQILMMPKSENFAWYTGYLIHDRLLDFPRYWFNNLGLHAILVPLGFLFIPPTAKKILAPLFFIFIFANLFRFSVEIAASHKFFNFALILGNIISAYLVATLLKRAWPLAVILIGILMLSGVIDFFVIKNDVKGSIADVVADERVAWIAENTNRDAIFLNSSYLYHPASLAGRSIFLGWPYFAWSEGYHGNRHELMKTVYESRDPSVFCPILLENNISYMTVEDTHGDPNLPTIDVDYFTNTFAPSFVSANGDWAILSVSQMCK